MTFRARVVKLHQMGDRSHTTENDRVTHSQLASHGSAVVTSRSRTPASQAPIRIPNSSPGSVNGHAIHEGETQLRAAIVKRRRIANVTIEIRSSRIHVRRQSCETRHRNDVAIASRNHIYPQGCIDIMLRHDDATVDIRFDRRPMNTGGSLCRSVCKGVRTVGKFCQDS